MILRVRSIAAALLFIIFLLSGCASDDTEIRRTFPALGTIITVEIQDADPGDAKRALAAIESELQRIGRDWYAWGSGELGRVNEQLARGTSARVSPQLARLIRRTLEISKLSDGYFDPTVGLLVEAWGFHDASVPPGAAPSEEWLSAWRAGAAERARIRISGDVIVAPGPVKIALGGIAKGSTLAAAMLLLRENGIENALVDAGGDLQVLGGKQGREWRIGVRDPRADGVLGRVGLRSGESIFSSGDYERFVERDGQRDHHLLDPHTGRPVAHTTAVTVIHTDPELADAAATALMAAGPDRFDALTRRLGIELALLVKSDGRLVMTPAMAARLRLTEHNGPPDGTAAKM